MTDAPLMSIGEFKARIMRRAIDQLAESIERETILRIIHPEMARPICSAAGFSYLPTPRLRGPRGRRLALNRTRWIY